MCVCIAGHFHPMPGIKTEVATSTAPRNTTPLTCVLPRQVSAMKVSMKKRRKDEEGDVKIEGRIGR